MNKEIITKNDKGNYHGYQQWYHYDKLWFRGNSKHGRGMGYLEWHVEHVVDIETQFHIR
jgi:hypothetical protein